MSFFIPRPRQRRPYTPRSPFLCSPRPWAPLTDDETRALWPYFARKGSGRPIFDLRGRLDAIFWAVTHDGFWRDLPPQLGPWDTASRQFRRWAHKGVWTQLLKDVATTRDPVLAGLKHWLCRAFRRAWRILGLEGIRLARRLGLHSALRAPVWMVPDPDLSDRLEPDIRAAVREAIGRPWLREALQAGIAFHRLVGGRAWVPRWLSPP
jgi:transposase